MDKVELRIIDDRLRIELTRFLGRIKLCTFQIKSFKNIPPHYMDVITWYERYMLSMRGAIGDTKNEDIVGDLIDSIHEYMYEDTHPKDHVTRQELNIKEVEWRAILEDLTTDMENYMGEDHDKIMKRREPILEWMSSCIKLMFQKIGSKPQSGVSDEK